MNLLRVKSVRPQLVEEGRIVRNDTVARSDQDNSFFALAPVKWVRNFITKKEELNNAQLSIAKIERLPGAPDSAINYFFENDLPRLAATAQKYPDSVLPMLEKGVVPGSPSEPWARLIQVACHERDTVWAATDTLSRIPERKIPVYLNALHTAAPFAPREATHLLQKVFERGDLDIRLTALNTVLFSSDLGDSRVVGDFFVKLMAASTKAEKSEIIEPTLEKWVMELQNPYSTADRNKLSWLNAFRYGWRDEVLA